MRTVGAWSGVAETGRIANLAAGDEIVLAGTYLQGRTTYTQQQNSVTILVSETKEIVEFVIITSSLAVAATVLYLNLDTAPRRRRMMLTLSTAGKCH